MAIRGNSINTRRSSRPFPTAQAFRFRWLLQSATNEHPNFFSCLVHFRDSVRSVSGMAALRFAPLLPPGQLVQLQMLLLRLLFRHNAGAVSRGLSLPLSVVSVPRFCFDERKEREWKFGCCKNDFPFCVRCTSNRLCLKI